MGITKNSGMFTVPWDIFIEQEKKYLSNTNSTETPIEFLRRWAVEFNCWKHMGEKHSSLKCPPSVRTHYIDIRPTELDAAIVWHNKYWESDLNWERGVQILKQIMKELPLKTAYITKQILKTANPADRKILEKQRERLTTVNESVNWSWLFKDLENLIGEPNREHDKLLQERFLKEWNYTFDQVMEIALPWQDMYATARLLKPYVKKALVVVGDDHRKGMKNILEELGFHLEYQSEAPSTKEICIRMPLLSQW